MNWEHLTSPDFEDAVRGSGGLCILPLGVLERHGDHLPLATDTLIVSAIARLAAKREPAVVFPAHQYTQIFEARHHPGTIAIGSRLMIDLLFDLCDEIARNGFGKIYILNGHGGNYGLVQFFLNCALERKRAYVPYCSTYGFDVLDADIRTIVRTKNDLHAGELETSLMMALRPDLVKTGAIPADPGNALARQNLPKGVSTPIGWYADYPDHYSGDARAATKEKGEKLIALCVDYVASVIRAIKNDTSAPGLTSAFYDSAFPGGTGL